jgi:hypothetical protein
MKSPPSPSAERKEQEFLKVLSAIPRKIKKECPEIYELIRSYLKHLC